MKKMQIGKLSVNICEHKGDIVYTRYVKFKQYAPQFWEKMDSPLFAAYMERYMEQHNKGRYAQALAVLLDYKFALDNSKNSYDAWMMCFALICIFENEDPRSQLNDAELLDKIEALKQEGITADVVSKEVVNFMKASPETFSDHVILYGLTSMMSEGQKLNN